MLSRSNAVAAISVLLIGCGESPVPDAVGPLEGAWQMIALADGAADGSRTEVVPQESLLLFDRSYYSMAYAYGDEPFPPYAESFAANDEEGVARFRSMTVNTGTYEATESTLTVRPMFALVPEFVRGSAEHDYEISGDTLTLTWRHTFASDGTESPSTAGGGWSELKFLRVR